MTVHRKKPLQSFDSALRLLDHELQGIGLREPIQIRAIGGYALLAHGVREGDRALTADIDTMTRDYSHQVQSAIRIVAEKLDLDLDWINNDNLGGNDPADVEAIYDAQWEQQDLGLRNINVSVADVPTLTRSKIIAVDAAGLASDREQDTPDLIALLRKQGITSLPQFRHAYPDPFDEFPMANEIVTNHFQLQREQTGASDFLLGGIAAALARSAQHNDPAVRDPFDDLDASIDDQPADDFDY